jgi:hypothetical protein
VSDVALVSGLGLGGIIGVGVDVPVAVGVAVGVWVAVAVAVGWRPVSRSGSN